MIAGIVADTLKGGFYWILLGLDGFVYSAITKLYKVYVLLAGARILTNDAFTTVANQIYTIIGVAMLFVLAYTIICAIINPDQMTKGERSGSKIVKGVLTAIIGLAITPVLFNVAYQGQDIILKKNVIANLFFSDDEYNWEIELESGKESGTVDANSALDKAGNVVAIYVWQSFFYPSELNTKVNAEEIKGKSADYIISPGATKAMAIGCAIGVGAAIVASIFTLGFGALAAVATVAACAGTVAGAVTGAAAEAVAEEISLAEAITMATSDGDFGIFTIFTENIIDGEITYFFGVSTIVGLFVCYTFLSFSIDMAVRAVKLAYYQIIAPIPLIMQILPEFGENFRKWRKDIIHTFLEVIIRLSIIYVVVFIICHLNVLTTSSAQLWANEDVSTSMGFFARLLLILGLIIFAKMAPKIISETFKLNSADMKLGIGKKLAEGGAFTAAATLGAAATGMVRNFNAEHKKDLPDGKENSLRARGGRLLKSGISGLAGGLSAGTRVAGGRAWDMAHGKKEPVNPHMAREAAKNAAEKAGAKKRARDQYKQEHPDGVIRGKAEDARDAIVTWATGPVDTSYQDGQAKLLSDLAGLKGLLEGKINPDDKDYKNAMDKVSRLQNANVADTAYETELQNRARALEGTVMPAEISALRSDARTQAEVAALEAATGMTSDKDLEDLLAGKYDSTMTAAEIAARDALKTAAQTRTYDAKSAREKAQESFKRSDFSIDVTSAEYRAAEEKLNRARADADKELKNVKKDIVARELAKSATGQETDISRTLHDFFTSHQKDIRTYSRTKFEGDKTILSYLQDTYGVQDDGTIDLSTVLKSIASKASGPNQTFEIKVEKAGSLDTIRVIADKDDIGKHRYELVDSSGGVIGGRQYESLEALQRELRTNYSGADFKDVVSVGGMAEGPTSGDKARIEQARDRLVSSEDYVRAHRRQQEQREKKKS